MITDISRDNLVESLHHLPGNGKAEIVQGEIVRMSPTGARPGRIAGRIFLSISEYEYLNPGTGFAFGENVGFLVQLPQRSSFSPDAAWYVGPLGDNEMDFLPGAPIFAVEVRSKGDYGQCAEQAIAEKIREYFKAGTQVIWDVDTLRGRIHVWRVDSPDVARVYVSGEFADAEPAVPGWTMKVNLSSVKLRENN